MVTILISSTNSKICYFHRLLLNISDNIDLKRSDKHIALSNLSIYYKQKIQTNLTKTINNLKYHVRHEMNSLNYLMDCILCHLLKNNFENMIKKQQKSG